LLFFCSASAPTFLYARSYTTLFRSVIVESIFAIPGMGQLMVQAVFERDYPVIMGNLVIVSTLTLVANLVADVTYSFVDPRIRVRSEEHTSELQSRVDLVCRLLLATN